MIRLKRAYEPASSKDGLRLLVERLWPRGLTRSKARIALWCRDLAPSTELRKWFHAHPDQWNEFKTRYFSELDDQETAVHLLQYIIRQETVTFVFATADEDRNSAVALKEYVEKRT